MSQLSSLPFILTTDIITVDYDSLQKLSDSLLVITVGLQGDLFVTFEEKIIFLFFREFMHGLDLLLLFWGQFFIYSQGEVFVLIKVLRILILTIRAAVFPFKIVKLI